MWTRESIKNYAKDFLRKYYFKAFLVCLIAALLGSNGSSIGKWGSTGNNSRQMIRQRDYYVEHKNPITNHIFKRSGLPYRFSIGRRLVFLISFVFFIISIIIANVIEVGKVRFFLRGFREEPEVGDLFSPFNSEEYFGIFKTQFIRGLYTVLWSLLLIIPGIIKSYEYRMVPYILSEDPNMPTSEVIDISREMTSGHKLSMFVLDLSFFGWYILGALLMGVGAFFVYPYEEAAYARLYDILSGNDDNFQADYEVIDDKEYI